MATVKERAYADFAKECSQIMSEFEAETESLITAITAAKTEQVRIDMQNMHS